MGGVRTSAIQSIGKKLQERCDRDDSGGYFRVQSGVMYGKPIKEFEDILQKELPMRGRVSECWEM